MPEFNRVDHIGVLVESLEDAKRFLGERVGLELVRELDVERLQRRVAFFQCGAVQIEVIEPYGPDRDRDLQGARARIEHIAVEVDDVRRALDALGLRPNPEGLVEIGGRETIWTDGVSGDGVIYQLVPRGW